MPFTDEEKKAWLAETRECEDDSALPIICDHCGNPFHMGQGVVTSDMALCDICNGD